MGRAERRKIERTERIENRKNKLLVTRKDLKDMRMSVSRDNVKFLWPALPLPSIGYTGMEESVVSEHSITWTR